jgi:nucleotide-binding universal stress UspA family protein
VKYALSFADAYHADVTVLHMLADVAGSADIAQETTAAAQTLERLLPHAATRSIGAHLAVRLGGAFREILQFASNARADLIVTGVRGRNALDLAAFGSTSYRAIQLGPCPVLAVPL